MEAGVREFVPQPGAKLSAAEDHFKNDIGYADAFANRHSKCLRFIADEGVWLTFAPGEGWSRDVSGNVIRGIAADFARGLYAESIEKARTLEPRAGIALVQSAVGLGNLKRIDPMLGIAQTIPSLGVRSSELDRDEFLVGVRNGVVNLRSGEFSPHSETHLVTRRLATAFDPSAKAPSFERFLSQVQPESDMRAFLQRLAGYSLTGSVREHVLPFHFGLGGNGKGVFLEQCILRLAGSYGAKLSDSLIYRNDRGTPPFLEIAGLNGKRFALGEENAAGAGLNEPFLKGATGGDRQKGRHHYADFVEFDPTAKLALVGNHKPRVEGRDAGFWRRFVLVDWPVQVPKESRDAGLPERLFQELPGVLNWCIEGARQWIARGLNPPSSCLLATEQFKAEADSLAGFVELFQADHDGWVTKARVFDRYRAWADEEGIPKNRQLTKRSLGFRLVERGWAEGKVSGGKYHAWLGLSEKEEGQP